MQKLKCFVALLLLVAGGGTVRAGSADLPVLSTDASPVYYVIQNAGYGTYMTYQERTGRTAAFRHRLKTFAYTSSDFDDGVLWYFTSADGSTSVEGGAKVANKLALVNSYESGGYLIDDGYGLGTEFQNFDATGTTFYIHANPYDMKGCVVSNQSAVPGTRFWHAKGSSDHIDQQTLTDANQNDYYKWIFKSFDDLLDDAEAQGLNRADYAALDRTSSASFKTLIAAIENAKASAGVPSIAYGNYLIKNRRFGYYLNTDNDGTTLSSVPFPTIHSVWNYSDVGGVKNLVSHAGSGSIIRITVSGDDATWDLTAQNPYNATPVRSSDGDQRYIAFQKASATNGWLSMQNKANGYTLYGRASQGESSDWELIAVPDVTALDNAVLEDEISEDAFYRLRNVSRSVSNYAADILGGGWLEDVDHRHFTLRKNEVGNAAKFVQDEADLFYTAREAEFYAAEPDMRHASALWQFVKVGHKSVDGENATGLISPAHDIYVLRNANTGKYIAKTTTTVGGEASLLSTTEKAQALPFYLSRLVDGQYGLMVYTGTGTDGNDTSDGAFGVTATADGYHGGLTKVGSATKNTNSSWLILPAPTLEIELLNIGTNDEYDWSTFYFPFDVKKSDANGDVLNGSVKFFQGGWKLKPNYSGTPVTAGEVEMTEEQDVAAGNAVIIRGPKNGGNFVLDVFPAGLTAMQSTDQGVNNFEGNVWKGIVESDDKESLDEDERWRTVWVLTKNSQNVVRLLHPAGSYLLPNRAYIDNETTTAASGGAQIKTLNIRFFETETELVMTGAGYGTLYYNRPLLVPEGIEAAAVTLENDHLAFDYCYTEGDVIPAETAVLVKGQDGRYVFVFADEAGTEPEANDLRGSMQTEMTTGGTTYYKLALGQADDTSSVGFYYGAEGGAPFLNKARKAYLATTSANGIRGFAFNGGPTGVKNVQAEGAKATTLYDLQGRRTKQPAAGVYIKGGKKVIVK